jgi:hypothetical protein
MALRPWLGVPKRREPLLDRSIDVPSCNFGVSPTKNPDVTAGHGPSMMLDPTWEA